MSCHADRRLLYAAAFVRAVAIGMAGVLLGIHLARLGFDAAAIGVVVAVGLAGAAAASLVATVWGDALGRRRLLVLLALLGAAGGLVVAVTDQLGVIVLAAFAGMLNGMGRDRGAALILEQAALPALTTDDRRTRTFAVYNVAQDAGGALGGLAAGVPALLVRFGGVDRIAADRSAFVLYAALLLVTAVLYAGLSRAVEGAPGPLARRVSRETRGVLARLSALFALDSAAGGFLTAALLGYFFFARFGAGEGVVSLLFFGARVLNAGSHLGAAWLARRIGLVNTMVFTHIPSSLLLVSVAFAPNFAVAAVLFLIREGLVEMDVPTRQSYVMAVVRPEERTVAAGVTGLVRTAGWALAPSFAGALMQRFTLAAPLFIGAGMKIAYDLALYAAFRGKRPPEEGA